MQDRIQKLVENTFYRRLRVAYFVVDSDLRIKFVSDNLADYGFAEASIGEAAENTFAFMTGLSANTEMELPYLTSPSGAACNVSFIPSDGEMTVIITDASQAAQSRQQLQQVANENELLVKQQKKLMHELAEASAELEQKNKALEEASRLQTGFLSGVSHEFRTPLTSIIGYTELLQKQIDQNEINANETAPAAADCVQAVQRSSKHLLSLIENLLDHGKFDSQEIIIRPQICNINELIEDVDLLLRPLAQSKAIELVVNFRADSTAFVVVDDSRIRQCLINIVGNAIKFTDEGSVTLDCKLSDGELMVKVTDTGLGISEDDLKKIRLPFYQAADTGKVGTGLGLTITEKIIQLMGGELKIESQLGSGTQVRFTVLAPLAESDAGVQSSVTPAKTNLRFLLAEDDSDIADLLLMLLGEVGVLVEHVSNGQEAVERLQNERFDLCLMDIHMPIMSGYEAKAELNRQGNTTPVVIMSASAIEADQQQAIELQCAGYLVKPVTVNDIIAIANTVLVAE